MSKKVTLPKEVAEAIELQRGYDHDWILFDIELLSEERHSSANKSLATIYRYYKLNKRDYFSALVNGYEVEQTPEENLREYYETFNAPFAERFIESEQHVIAKTLNILGIKIAGINA
jgi:hypothetical protein